MSGCFWCHRFAAGHMSREWKLEFGEGSTVAWVQGSACWQLKLGPTRTQPSQAVWPERFMDPKERVGPMLLKGAHTL